MANVITYGTFDLFHVGHLRLLQRVRSVVRKELLCHGADPIVFDPLKTQKIDAKLSRTMAMMGLVCAILVVMIHADVSASGWQGQIIQVIRGFTRIAVPWFFLAAGFFLAGHVGEPGWWRAEVAKRVKSLLIPFFCWLWIYRLFDVVLNIITNLVGYKFGGGAYYGLGDEIIYLLGIHPFRLAGIVWFLRALFLFVLVSPLVCLRSRRMTYLLLGMFFLAYAGHEGCRCGNQWLFFEYFFPLRGLFYFTLGLTVRRFGFRFKRSPLFVLSLSAFGAFLLYVKCFCPLVLGGAWVADVLMIPFLMYGLFCLVSAVHMPMWLKEYSLPIYLIHMPLLITLAGVFSICHLKGFYSTSLMAFAIKLMVVIPVTILIAKGLRRGCPRLHSVLLGGR